ncbi:MAG: hypothetical protein HZC06_02880 [Methylocystis sp.]|nr:hypothetical protein [Methylocystis sp.]
MAHILAHIHAKFSIVHAWRLRDRSPKQRPLERFPITWTHVIDKESLNIEILERVLIENVCQLFRNLL